MNESNADDEQWMRHALNLAEQARDQDEVPVGAVVVDHDTLIGEGFNTPISKHDASAHASMHALRASSSRQRNLGQVPPVRSLTFCKMKA